MKLPVLSSNQNAPLAWCPAGRMEARSFNATPTTLERLLVASRSSSPMVVVHILRGDISPASLSVPTGFTVLSSVQYTTFPSFTKLLPAMPWMEGTEPV